MDHAQDERDIRALITGFEEAWNKGDATAFSAPLADDADFIDVLGRHHTGRAPIEEGHKVIFSTFYRGSRMHYEVEKIRFLRDDLAIAFVRAWLKTTVARVDGADRDSAAPVAEHEEGARPSFLLEKKAGTWKAVSIQNTRVA